MIKRFIAGALSAALCAPAGVSDLGLQAFSGFDGTAAAVAADTAAIPEAAAVTTTAAATTTKAASTTTTAAATTTTTAATTTKANGGAPTIVYPLESIELGENITADVYESGIVYIRGYGEMNDFSTSPFKDRLVKSVTISDTSINEGLVITNIGSGLFRDCDQLCAVNSGFGDTSGRLVIPDSIKSVGEHAFDGCSAITELQLGSGLKTIGSYAFAGCTGLTELTVPANVTAMERMAFMGCTGITDLTLPYAATNSSCAEADGDSTPNCSVTDLFYEQHWNWGNDEFDATDYKLTKITVTGGDKIPQYAFSNLSCVKEIDLSGTSVSAIDKYAFNSCTSLTAVKLPATLKSIGEGVFAECVAVKEFELPDGLESLDPYAFRNCTGISSLTIPGSVTAMGRMLLSGCTELTELTLPYAATLAECTAKDGDTNPDRSVTDLFYDQHWNWQNDEADFSGCKLRKVTITGGEKVPSYAFSNMSSLTEIDLSGTKTAAIDSYAFYNCSALTDIKLPDTVTDIGAYAYSATPITELPDNGAIKNLGNGVFADCVKLEITTLPASYETLGQYSFSGCTGITSLTVPENIKAVGKMSFSGCTALRELTLPYAATNSSCSEADGDTTPDCSVTDLFYDQHWNWDNSDFDASELSLTKLTITGGDKIPRSAFSNLYCVTEIDLSGSGVTAIDAYAFYNCTSLTELKLPAELKNIGEGAFRGCSAMKDFRLPDGLETIAEYAFADCTNVSALVIPDSVTSMGRMMLNGCLGLETLTLPYAATKADCAAADGTVTPDNSVSDLFIDQHWNWGNDEMDFSPYAVSKIIINGGQRIPRYAFSNMTSLKEVELRGKDIASVEEYAFGSCSGLDFAELPENVTEIAANAFAGSNADIYVYGKDTTLAEQSLSEGYSGTVHGYKGSPAETYAGDNEFAFEPVDGETVIGPKTISMAVGDTYTIKTGVPGATFKSDNADVVKVDKKGVITAVSEGEAAVTVTSKGGKTAVVSVSVRLPATAFTLGDPNEDGKIDANDASFVLVEYAKLSTGGVSTLTQAAKSAADVNGDGRIDSKDASVILAYYAYLSTGGSDRLEKWMSTKESV